MSSRTRDIYGRKPTSRSRGKTQDRILQLQHAAGTLPGAEELLVDAPDGSLGASLVGFHRDWVESQAVTSRRAYERSLVLLARDLDATGPPLAGPVTALDTSRLAAHLQWRVQNGLDHPGELQRAAVHLGRLAEWLDANAQTRLGDVREELRSAISRLVG